MSADIESYLTTEKQRGFAVDFIEGWDTYEAWDTVEIGVERVSPRRFVVTEEDVLSYNLALGETDPLMVDPEYARRHAPGGTLVAHPLIVVPIVFNACVGDIGTWVRTPGARNPAQTMELLSPIEVGDEVSVRITTTDRWIRRGKHYITNYNELYAGERLAVRWWGTLIIPPTREAVRAFAEA